MELALYHPEYGYYASRQQRSGRSGDFYTSVDVGPLFGELLAVQFARMASVVPGEFSLVEAAAGNGRLTRDVLDGLERDAPDVYARTQVHLVERSAEARGAQRETLGPHAGKLVGSSPGLASPFSGVLFANELLDALPVHVIVMREDGPGEIFVDAVGDALIEREGPVSSPGLLKEFEAGPPLGIGMRAEVNLAAREWIEEAARRLTRGYMVLVDYGDTAAALRSPVRPEGTLRAFRGHHVSGNWMASAGDQDLTTHVDFTALERWAGGAGLELLERTDQTRFLIGLGAIERLQAAEATRSPVEALRRRLALKTLLVPGGMGSTHQVLMFGKRGQPPLPRFSPA
jgi:SAM-dependent MidA family methyltransferase